MVRPNKIKRSSFLPLQPKQQTVRKARKRPAESSVGSNVVELDDVPSPTKVARRFDKNSLVFMRPGGL